MKLVLIIQHEKNGNTRQRLCDETGITAPLPIIEVEQVCLLGVVAQGRKGMIGDLPLMPPICAGCFSAGSPVPRRRRRRRRAATAAAYLRS